MANFFVERGFTSPHTSVDFGSRKANGSDVDFKPYTGAPELLKSPQDLKAVVDEINRAPKGERLPTLLQHIPVDAFRSLYPQVDLSSPEARQAITNRAGNDMIGTVLQVKPRDFKRGHDVDPEMVLRAFYAPSKEADEAIPASYNPVHEIEGYHNPRTLGAGTAQRALHRVSYRGRSYSKGAAKTANDPLGMGAIFMNLAITSSMISALLYGSLYFGAWSSVDANIDKLDKNKQQKQSQQQGNIYGGPAPMGYAT